MKKILNILFLMVMTVSLFSQTTLTFEGKDRTGQDYMQLSRVSVFDLDQLWHQEIFYPDTTLVLYVNGTVGVGTWCTASLQMQNNPNPFDGTTDVVLSTPYEGDVTMEITDVNGRAVFSAMDIVRANDDSPKNGTHQFRLTLSAPGTYVLTARQNGRTVSVKMVNSGNGGNNGIEYMGIVRANDYSPQQPKSGTRGNGNYPFNNGDLMRYTGYAVVDDVEIESETIQNTQNGSQTIPLKFDVARPEVVTNDATSVAATAAMLHGEVTADNNANVTERGFCYGTAPSPTYSSSTRVEAGDGLGSFDATINGLTAATTYYTRAYAKNVVGLSYGANLSFRTLDTLPVVITTEPSNITATTFTSGGDVLVLNSNSLTARGICWNTTGTPTIADSYTTQTGGLGSFTSNVTGLECGTTYYVRAYATNSVGTAYGEEYSVTTADYSLPIVELLTAQVNATNIIAQSEVLTENCAAVTARGVCWNTTGAPTVAGNHTDDGDGLGSFTSNLTELTPNTTYYLRAYATNGIGTAYGEQMAIITECDIVTVTINGSTTINYGQSATLTASGAVSYHWSTGGNGNTITISPTSSTVYAVTGTDSYGCTNTASITVTVNPVLPTVATTAVTNITSTTVTSGGNVTSDGGAMVTARGVCRSTSHNPTISNSHTTNGTGTGIFTSSLTGLTAGTTYYLRAYATNSAGTAYGNEVSFTTATGQPCPGAATLTDRDGNTYNTVLIGQQCWMKENLRTTKYADGTSISQGNSVSYDVGYWYYPDNSSSNKPTYGLLYNWKAVMRNSSSSSANPSGVQGICPTGWHVPSDAEFTQLTDYVSSQSQCVCGSDNRYIAKALASTTGWSNYSGDCTVGNTPSSNNVTGFSALPAGYYVNGDTYFGLLTFFWSASENTNIGAAILSMLYYNAYVSIPSNNKGTGCSIRCVKD